MKLIDYLKILLLKIDIDRLLNLSFLDFKTKVSENTGLLSTKKVAEYHFCKITVYGSGIVLFTGSIHKLWNSLNDIKSPNYKNAETYKGFNGNQFTLENIIEVRNHLENLFNCVPKQMIFQNIEIGVNTTPIFNPKSYINGLLYHKNKLFEYRYNGNSAQVQHQRYIFKIYNKSIQYEMNNFVLRIELKIIKLEELKKIGLSTFADINNTTLEKAKQMLLRRFDEVMHYDYTINKKGLTKTQNQSLNSYSNPRYWINELRPQHRHRHKKRINEITLNYSEKLHHQIRQDIFQKCVIINQLSKNTKCVINNTSSIGFNITHNNLIEINKKCSITGLSLKHEKGRSKYIRTSTLKYLHKYDIKTFVEVCSSLLSNTNSNRPKFENDIISHLAKQVRNRYYNQLTIRQTGYNQKRYFNQIELFN